MTHYFVYVNNINIQYNDGTSTVKINKHDAINPNLMNESILFLRCFDRIVKKKVVV